MKCHLCVNYIEIQTDPASCDYVIVSGAQRKEERWDMKDNEQILTTEHSEKEKLETDPMFKLEHGSQDRGKLQRSLPSLSHIQEKQEAWRDDFRLNSALRRKFRAAVEAERDLGSLLVSFPRRRPSLGHPEETGADPGLHLGPLAGLPELLHSAACQQGTGDRAQEIIRERYRRCTGNRGIPGGQRERHTSGE
ncbi:UNVERIFIED_CONTAM: hypothetical protein FKN15_050997 [Acipenser sinensis]